MRDFQFWLYIIVGVIYLIGRLRKKQPEQPEAPAGKPEKPVRQFERPTANPIPAASAPKSLTFEELLREITESKTPQPEYVDYDDNLKEEEQDLEDVEYNYRKQDKIYDVYEEAKREAFNRPSLEETMKVEDTVVRYEKFKMFEQEQRRDLVQEYLADFKDPEGLKKAVVMSEILQRKF
ncbi:hypothetical protein [Ohtaekwangia sp.]|uniref:hypothetical protein n=1 Tax=Ohtaekwangia sp. TaxID=2066019 RepID=UPI002FDE6CFE